MATRDFRSQQIRTTQLIASGTDSSKPSMLLYSASAATNDQGAVQSDMLTAAGSDTWLFVSGSTAPSDNEQVLFGGNVVLSGTLSGSGFASLSGGDLTFDSGDDIIFNSAGTEYFQIKNDSQDEVVVNDGSNDIDFRVETDNLQSAIHVNAGQDLIVLGRSDAPADLTAASSPPVGTDVKVFIDGTANSKDGATRGSTLVAGDLVVSGTLFAERQVMEVDLSQPGPLVLSSSLHFDDLGAAAGPAGQTSIRVPLNDGALFVATGSLIFKSTPIVGSSVENKVGQAYAAGNGLEESTIGSTTTFSTDDSIVAHLTGSEFNGPVGVTGSLGVVGDIALAAEDYLYLNGLGGLVRLRGYTNALDIDGDNTLRLYSDTNTQINAGSTGTANTTNFNSTGTEFNTNNQDVDFEVNTNTYNATLFIDGNDESIILGSQDFATNPAASDLATKGYGADVKILLSGSAGSKDSTTRGVVSVPGDMVVSGTLYYGNDSASESYLSSPGNGLSRRHNNIRTVDLSLTDISGSAAITALDSFAFIDSDDNSATKRTSVSQLVGAIAGDGLQEGDGANAGKLIVNAGNGLGIDGGALVVNTGNGVKVSSDNVITDDAVVAHLSGSQFNGTLGVTGSLGVIGDLTVSQFIRHAGDSDTHIEIETDQIRFTAGNKNSLNIIEDAGNSEVVVNEAGDADLDFRVESNNKDKIIFVNSGFDYVSIGSDDGVHQDNHLFVSGAIGGITSQDGVGGPGGVAVFGGDVVVSGTLYSSDHSPIKLSSYSEKGSFSTPPNATGTNAVAIGNNTLASGNRSIAIGSGISTNEATGQSSAAIGGENITASGDYSAVLGGQNNTASGHHSKVIGQDSTASGVSSVAIGSNLNVSESNTIALGSGTNHTHKIVASGSFKVTGSATIDGAVTLADSDGDVILGNTADLIIPTFIKHKSDLNTYFQFNTDRIRLVTNGATDVDIKTNQVIVNPGDGATPAESEALDTNFFVSGSAGSKDTATRGTSVFGGDVHISGSLSGPSQYALKDNTVRVFRDGFTMKFVDGVTSTKTLEELASVAASVDHFIGVHGNGSQVSRLKTSASIAFAGDLNDFPSNLAANGVGSDVYFFVSGSAGGKDGASRRAALFGGDVVVSGSTHLADITGSFVKATGAIMAGGNIIKNSNDDTVLRFHDSVPGVMFGSDDLPQTTIDIRQADNTVLASGVDGNDFSNYNIALRNNSTTTNAFAGIAFDVHDVQDPDSIGASIAVLRDSTANLTNHDANMVFMTNDSGDDGLTERVRITHDGKVGIGIDTPSRALDVNGDIKVRGNNILDVNGVAISFDGSQNTALAGALNVTGDITGSAFQATTGNYFAAPGQSLGLYSPHHVVVYLDTDNNASSEFKIRNGAATEILVVNESGDLQIDGDLTVSGDKIKDSGNNTVFSFDGSGNVDNAVDFSSGVTVAGNFDVADRIRNIGDTNTQIRFLDTDKISMETSAGGMFLINSAATQDLILFNDVGADVDFQVKSDTQTHALFVKGEDGNVGISNSNPSFPLDVTGDIQLSGDLRLNGNEIKSSTGVTAITLSANDVTIADGLTTGGDITVEGGNVFIERTTNAPDLRLRLQKTTISDGDDLGQILAYASENGTDYHNVGYIMFEADEDFDYAGNNAGSRIKFATNTNGSSSPTNKMELDNLGNLQIDGDLTVSGNDIKDSGGNSVLSFNGSGYIDSDLDIVGTNYSIALISRTSGNGAGEPIILIQTEQGSTGFSQGSDLGQILFKGSNDSFGSHAVGFGVGGGAILAEADGTWSNADYPTRFHFLLTNDGSSSPQVRARLDHDGDWFTEGNHFSGASLFTEGHRYSSDEDLEPGDTVVLVNGKIKKSTSPMQKNVAGIVFYREHEKWRDWPIHDDEGGNEDDPDRDLSLCRPITIKDSFENTINRGVYNSETGEWEKTEEYKNLWKLASIGDSRQDNLVGFKICDEGGAVEPGDLLCTSSTAGYLMKQSDDVIRSYTVGKSMETVAFDSSGKATGVYGYVYCG